jgi:hypothetical protein
MEDNPNSRALALNALGSHPAWPLYIARFNEVVANEIDAVIFDPKTTDEIRRSLVLARKLLVTGYTPEKMRQSMLVVAETQIIRADNERAARR